MISLVDTDILVYRCDPRDPAKRAAAMEVLRRGVTSGDLRIPHQALVEFVSSVTRSRAITTPLMTNEAATRQVVLFMIEFEILYPTEQVLRTALRGILELVCRRLRIDLLGS